MCLTFFAGMEINMAFFNKEIISEKTLLIWLICTVLSGIALMLVFSMIIYSIYGCWPLGGYRAGGSCLSNLPHIFFYFLPSILGIIIGTLLTRKINRQ
jgi:hypothetical protein